MFNGQSNKPGSSRRTLAEVLKAFARRDGQFMQRFATATHKGKRPQVAHSRGELVARETYWFRCIDLGNGWWLNGDLTIASSEGYIETACQVAGVKYGSELTLIRH